MYNLLVVLQLLKDQKTDIKGFADFMQRLLTVKEHVPSLKEKVEYIKNLYEVKSAHILAAININNFLTCLYIYMTCTCVFVCTSQLVFSC